MHARSGRRSCQCGDECTNSEDEYPLLRAPPARPARAGRRCQSACHPDQTETRAAGELSNCVLPYGPSSLSDANPCASIYCFHARRRRGRDAFTGRRRFPRGGNQHRSGSAMKDTLGVLLAGGAGERLYPLTRDRAKPAVTFGGIYRIIDITLSNCVNSDLRRVYILTQYKALSLNRHIREGWNIMGREMDEFIEVLPPMKRVSEQWYQGTADAVYQNIYS